MARTRTPPRSTEGARRSADVRELSRPHERCGIPLEARPSIPWEARAPVWTPSTGHRIVDNWKRFGYSSAQRLRWKREACMAARHSARQSGRLSTNRDAIICKSSKSCSMRVPAWTMRNIPQGTSALTRSWSVTDRCNQHSLIHETCATAARPFPDIQLSDGEAEELRQFFEEHIAKLKPETPPAQLQAESESPGVLEDAKALETDVDSRATD